MATSRGRGARLKGANFERNMATKLTELTGIEFKRGLGQTRMGGSEVSDILAKDLPAFHFELKKQKRCNIKAAMLQAETDTKKSGKTCVVITKDDDANSILVTMKFSDWVPLFNAFLRETQVPGSSTSQEK